MQEKAVRNKIADGLPFLSLAAYGLIQRKLESTSVLPVIDAWNWTAMRRLTRAVSTVNTAVRDPAGIVINVGPRIDANVGSRLATLICNPPVGAMLLSVTVPIANPPP